MAVTARYALVLFAVGSALLSPCVATSGSRWVRVIGGPGYERTAYIGQTRTGGCVLIGSVSPDGISSWVAWAVMLDAGGRTIWERTYPGGGVTLWSAQQTSDGGFILVGETSSLGAVSSDAWSMKLDSSGDVEWQRTYGDATEDVGAAIQQTRDGGYILAGYTYPYGNPILPDGWCMRLDSEGRVLWSRAYAGSSGEFLTSVQETADGGYIACGITFSPSAGLSDAWVVKLDSSGDLVWQRAYGGPSLDITSRAHQTRDGGYMVWGFTKSFGIGEDQAWLLKLDPEGSITWQRCFGRAGVDSFANSVVETTSGSYLVVGSSSPVSGGMVEGWCLALGPEGDALWKRRYAAGGSTGLGRIAMKSDGGYILSGSTTATKGDGRDLLLLSVTSTGGIRASCDVIVNGKPELLLTQPAAATAESSARARLGPAQSGISQLVPEQATTPNTVLCASPDQPDLTAAWRGVQRNGNIVSGSVVCENIGLRAAHTFKLKVFLSDDQRAGPGDALVLTVTIEGLAGATESPPIRVEFSKGGSLAQKYLIAIVDSGSAIFEENELNNTVAKLIP